MEGLSEVWDDTLWGIKRPSIWDIAPPETPEMPRMVYVLGPAGGPYKVGVSWSPDRRARGLRLKGVAIKVWGAKSVARPFKVEWRAHWILSNKALGGEWFDCTLAEAVAAVEAAAEDIDCQPNLN